MSNRRVLAQAAKASGGQPLPDPHGADDDAEAAESDGGEEEEEEAMMKAAYPPNNLPTLKQFLLICVCVCSTLRL